MYDYITPDGFGDYFYQYVFDPAAYGFVNGGSYAYIPIEIQDYDFVLRMHAGEDSFLTATGGVSAWGTIQLYDAQTRLFYDTPTSVFSGDHAGTAVLPEKVFPANSALRFDAGNVTLQQDATSTLSVAQLVFTGVRRIRNAPGDPLPSSYKYKNRDFSILTTFVVPTDATAAGPGNLTQYTVPVQDYDFELRRIEGSYSLGTLFCYVAEAGGTAFAATTAAAVTLNIAFGPNSVTVVGDTITITGDTSVSDMVTLFNATAAATAIASIAVAGSTCGTLTANPGNTAFFNYPVSGQILSPTPLTGALDTVEPPFQITLYDANWVGRSNSPVNSNRIIHSKLAPALYNPNNPMNFFPSPGILYPVNSVIRFDILSLIPAGGSGLNVTLVFKGVRRIPC